MNFPLPPEIISAILGPYGPLANVRANWPLVEAALDRRDIYSPLSAVAAISTIGIETGTFSRSRSAAVRRTSRTCTRTGRTSGT